MEEGEPRALSQAEVEAQVQSRSAVQAGPVAGAEQFGLRCNSCPRISTARSKFCQFCGDRIATQVSALLKPPELVLPALDEDSGDESPASTKQAKLVIHILEAKGLRAADFSLRGGSSDPFCEGHVSGKPEQFCQTRHITRNLNPDWNETFEIKRYTPGDDFEFKVMDYDQNSDADLLGRVTLPSDMFNRQGGFEGNLTLEEAGHGYEPTLKVKVYVEWFVPAPPVSVVGSRLRINVISARGLRAADWSFGGGKSDPFVICQLEGNEDMVTQTRHIEKTLTPEWYEELEMPEYERGEFLSLAVFDFDKGSAADLLGKITLDPMDFDCENGFDGELRLLESGGTQAFLKVQVEVLGPRFPEAEPVSVDGSRLAITVISARGLRAADWSLMGVGKSDPYCVVEVQDKPDMKIQTNTISKTLEPEWNEEYEFPEYENGDNLIFKVYDYDKGSAADLLGAAKIPSSFFDREDGFEGEVQLMNSGNSTAKLTVRVEVLGPRMPEAETVSVPGSRLMITVMSATGLRAADFSLLGKGSSDPFCSCEIDGKEEMRIETKHVSKNLNPVWNEEHEINMYEQGEGLLFQIFDYDAGSAADLLGKVKLYARDFDREDGFEGEVKLMEGGVGPQPSLRIRVDVLPPLLPDAPPVSEVGSRLKVTVISAKGLRAADWAFRGPGSSDPYCICEIQDKDDLSFQTKHLSKTLEPVWNEEHEIPMYDRGDNLLFKIYDYDRGSAADLLGRAVLLGRDFDREGGYHGEIRLMDSGTGGAPATLTVQAEVLPPLLSARPPVSEVGSRLQITMIGAKGLRAADLALFGKGSSDPYCVCELKGKPESKCQTVHINKTLEPEWNEEHEIDDYDQGDVLLFSVYDYDRGSAADLLGKGILSSNMFDREGGYDGTMNLRECGKGANATLSVRVRVLPPAWPDVPPVSEPGSRLKIKMISAEGLRAADWSLIGTGKSDPFCVCTIRGKPDSKVQTKHISKTLDPVWDEEHEIEDYEQGDALDFQVFDYDMGSAADLLGRVSLISKAFDKQGGFEGELKLKEGGPNKPTLKLKIQVTSGCLLPPAPPISVPGARVRVVIKKAEALRAADFSLVGGKSDPYCLCEIKGKPESQVKTRTIMKDLNPVWDEEHFISNYERGDALVFSVWDYDRVGSPDLLGRLTIAAGDIDREGIFDSTVKLRETGQKPGKPPSKLSFAVEVLPPETPDAPPVSLPGCHLEVKIGSARGLRAADWSLMNRNAKSDPFCECEIVGKPKSKVITRTIKKTLSPVWDEDHEISDYELGDGLLFTVYDWDAVGSNDLLGKVVLPSREFDREGGFSGDLKLTQCGEGKKAMVTVTVKVVNPNPHGPTVSKARSRLRIKVIRANGLRAADWSLLGCSSDPFCRVEIAGKPQCKVETKHINKNLNPVWNQEFEMLGYSKGDKLEFTVLDYDIASAADLLGRVTLPHTEFDREGGFEGSLRLKESGKGNPPSLTLSVEVLPPAGLMDECISEKGCSLKVMIKSAMSLIPCAGLPDPFCVAMVRGKTATSFKTHFKLREANPEWNEEKIIHDYEVGDKLDFVVMDWDIGEDADMLGDAVLESWLFDKPGGYEGPLKLRHCRGGGTSFLNVKVEVLPPGRVPLDVSIFRASKLMNVSDLCGFVVLINPVGRRRTQLSTHTKDLATTSEVVFDEDAHVSEYVNGDDLELQVQAVDPNGQFVVVGTSTVKAADIRTVAGFNGEVRLINSRGAYVGLLRCRLETQAQKEARAEREAEEKRLLEEKKKNEEMLRLQKLLDDERRLKEEAEERARRERDRRAAEVEAARQLALLREVVVAVHISPTGEVLAQVPILAGATVHELAAAAAKASKLPACPRLILVTPAFQEVLDFNTVLYDMGITEGPAGPAGPNAKVYAEAWPVVITAGQDGSSRLWNMATGDCALTVHGHGAGINCVDTTADLKWMVTASKDSTAKVWVIDAVDRVFAAAWTLEGHSASVNFASFSQDAQFVVTASSDRTAKVWRMKTGQCMRTFEDHNDEVISAKFSPDMKWIFTVTADKALHTFETQTGRAKETLRNQEPEKPLTFSSDRRYFLKVGPNMEVEIRDLESGEVQMTFKGHTLPINWASFATLRQPQANVLAHLQPRVAAMVVRPESRGVAKTPPKSLRNAASLVLQANRTTKGLPRSASTPGLTKQGGLGKGALRKL